MKAMEARLEAESKFPYALAARFGNTLNDKQKGLWNDLVWQLQRDYTDAARNDAKVRTLENDLRHSIETVRCYQALERGP